MTCPIITVREVAPYQRLVRCSVHGFAWVENGTAGIAHSPHPNAATNLKLARAKLGYTDPVLCNGFVRDRAEYIATDELDRVAAAECKCGGFHGSGPGPDKLADLFLLGPQ